MEVLKIFEALRDLLVLVSSLVVHREVEGRFHFRLDPIRGDSVKITRISSILAKNIKVIGRIGLAPTEPVTKFCLSENESAFLPIALPPGSVNQDKLLVLQWNEGWKKYSAKFRVELLPQLF